MGVREISLLVVLQSLPCPRVPADLEPPVLFQERKEVLCLRYEKESPKLGVGGMGRIS